MRHRILILALGALLAAPTAFADDSMIEIGRAEDGRVVVATPVIVEHRADGTTSLRRFDDDSVVRQAREEDRDPIDAVFSTSIRLSYPQVLSVSLGVVIGDYFENNSWGTGAEGVLVQLEPGIRGGKLSLGGAFLIGTAMSLGTVGGDSKASLLRTWNVAHPATYAGVEWDATIFLLKLSVGVFRKVAGDASARKWLPSIGLGLGF